MLINRNSGYSIFPLLANAVAANIQTGQFCVTIDGASAADGLGAVYRVVANGSGGIAMANGNELILMSDNVVKGADEDGKVPTVANSTIKDSSTGASNLPAGTTAERPDPAIEGMTRYNTEFGQYEGFDGTTWSGLGGASGGAGNPFVYLNDIIVTEDFTIPVGKNGMSAGAITVADGVTVTVSDGSSYTVVGG